MSVSTHDVPLVLVVDDEEGLRSLLEYRLEQMDFEVETANDGKAALDILSARGDSFDALILDLSMPKMDGFELMRRLDPLELDLVIFVLSGRDSEDEQLRAYELGANDYVKKPFSPAVLATKLKNSLGKAG